MEENSEKSTQKEDSVVDPEEEDLEDVLVDWDTITPFNKKPHLDKYMRFLDQKIYGGDHAKATLAQAVVNSINNLNHPEYKSRHQNILIIGPRGVGKSFLPKALAGYLKIPFVKIDLAILTPEENITIDKNGKEKKVTETVGQALRRTILEEGIAADDKIDKGKHYYYFEKNSQLALVYIDNIDCLIEKESLLGEISNKTVKEFTSFLSDDYYLRDDNAISTKNMVYICGGSFRGINNTISERINGPGGAKTGFMKGTEKKIAEKDKNNIITKATTEDLIKYGLNEHLAEQFHMITYMKNLERNDFIQIFKMRDSLLKKKTGFLYYNEGIKVRFTADGREELAKHLMKLGKNMKGLESAIDTILAPFYLRPRNHKGEGKTLIKINREMVEKHLKRPYL